MEIEGTEYTFIINQNGSIQHSNVEYKEDGDVLINAKNEKDDDGTEYNVGFVTDGWAKYAIDPETEDNVEFYVDFLDPTSVMAISGSIALCSMCPVNDVSGAVVLYDNVGWVEIAVAYLLMLVHTLEAGVQLITCGGVEVGFADLAVHFVL